ncbi:hypothetical protein M5K25_001657 [Dendrobium thyrsiflorum]|uniref:Uncharacterized protein n=1 Tax=Dendrobium thyrsiflorum TaxID=117978 RepID=A0ABD0VSF4_DENTH
MEESIANQEEELRELSSSLLSTKPEAQSRRAVTGYPGFFDRTRSRAGFRGFGRLLTDTRSTVSQLAGVGVLR